MWLSLRLLIYYRVTQRCGRVVHSRDCCVSHFIQWLLCVQFLLSDCCTFFLLQWLLYIYSFAYLLVKGKCYNLLIEWFSWSWAECFVSNLILKFTVRLIPPSTGKPMTETKLLSVFSASICNFFFSAIYYLEGECTHVFLFLVACNLAISCDCDFALRIHFLLAISLSVFITF